MLKEIVGHRIVGLVPGLTDHPQTLQEVTELCTADLSAFSEKDPSSGGDPFYILDTYSSYKAILFYRIAHAYFRSGDIQKARQISEQGKVETGIEIHPAARIGRRFVIDHGVGTVIGETAVIGDNCYFLQCVILGASKIVGNTQGQRHPTVGHNVEIGGFSSLIGPIHVGDNTRIAPHTILRNPIPPDSRVFTIGNLQVTQGGGLSSVGFKGYRLKAGSLSLYFSPLEGETPLATMDGTPLKLYGQIFPDKLLIPRLPSGRLHRLHISFPSGSEFIITIMGDHSEN